MLNVEREIDTTGVIIAPAIKSYLFLLSKGHVNLIGLLCIGVRLVRIPHISTASSLHSLNFCVYKNLNRWCALIRVKLFTLHKKPVRVDITLI